jgi:hypothetical protein
MSVIFEEWLGIKASIVSVRGDEPAIAFPGIVGAGPQPANKGSVLTFAEVLRDSSTGALVLARPDVAENKTLKRPRLNDGWDMCRLSHHGSEPVAPWGTLKDWDPTNDRRIRDYEYWSADILSMVAETDELHRIEGSVPFFDSSGRIVWDFVRIVYVENALANPGPNRTFDWIVIGTSPVKDRGRQEGGGHGPPS